jgi:hypothetical protein
MAPIPVLNRMGSTTPAGARPGNSVKIKVPVIQEKSPPSRASPGTNQILDSCVHKILLQNFSISTPPARACQPKSVRNVQNYFREEPGPEGLAPFLPFRGSRPGLFSRKERRPPTSHFTKGPSPSLYKASFRRLLHEPVQTLLKDTKCLRLGELTGLGDVFFQNVAVLPAHLEKLHAHSGGPCVCGFRFSS